MIMTLLLLTGSSSAQSIQTAHFVCSSQTWWGGGDVDVPDEAFDDPKFQGFYKMALRDEGTRDPINWFELCKSELEGFKSGSMTKSTVQNSYNKLLQDAADANITVCEVFNWKKEDWIKPFNTELIPGTCKVAKKYSVTPNPTSPPTISAFPTTPSTNKPTWTTDDGKNVGNICLTNRLPDRYRTCFRRKVDPKYSNLTKDSILRAQYNKGALHNCSKYNPSHNESYIKPYTPPYITSNETLTNSTVYLSLVTAERFNKSLS
jgi:hypothetical protein